MELKDKQILLVEDDPFIGQMLARKLGIAGATYKWAKDGVQGIEILKNGGIDLVVADLMMPNMSGSDMITAIKKDPAMKNIPIVILTNRMDLEDDKEQVKQLGVQGMFIKSNTSLEDLVKEIARVLEK